MRGGRSLKKNQKQKQNPGAGGEKEEWGAGARATQSVRGNYKPFYGHKSDSCGRNASVYHVYPVSRTTGEGGTECSKGVGGGELYICSRTRMRSSRVAPVRYDNAAIQKNVHLITP